MKFFSISNIYDSAAQSMKRFYLPLLIAVVGTISGIALVESTSEKAEDIIPGIILTCVLAMNFSFGAMLYAERRKSGLLKVLIPVITIALSLLYWFFCAPDTIFQEFISTLLFFILFIIVHLWVAVAAYVNIDEKTAFWHFNEALFLRIITSAIFSAVLFGGISLAIFALDSLFNYDTNDRMYADLWIVVVGIFNTWFFLSGVPQDYQKLNQVNTFPKGLKIFVQYILIPLAIIYLLILYAYSAKILVEWNLPNGWVSMLILWYAVFGILAILLAYPLRDDTDNPWVRLYSRFFFVGLLPLIILLFIAVGVRIDDYGVTELRYYVVLLGIWLMMMALYFIFSKHKNIKAIPVTLIVFGVLTLFGPWSVFSISKSSQVGRFEKLILKNGIWDREKGFIQKDSLAYGDADQIESIIDFLVERRAEAALSPYFDINFDSLTSGVIDRLPEYEREYKHSHSSWVVKDGIKDSLFALMSLDELRSAEMIEAVPEVMEYYTAEKNLFIEIQGYSRVVPYSYYEWDKEQTETMRLGASDSIMIVMSNTAEQAMLKLYFKNDADSINIMPLINSLWKEESSAETSPTEQMTLISSKGKYKLVLQSISTNGTQIINDKLIDRLDGLLLMK